MKHIPSNMSTK